MDAFDKLISETEQKQSRRREIDARLREYGIRGSTDLRLHEQLWGESAKLETEVAHLIAACSAFGRPTDGSTSAKKETILRQLAADAQHMINLQSKLTPPFGPGSDRRLNEVLQGQVADHRQRIADLNTLLRLL